MQINNNQELFDAVRHIIKELPTNDAKQLQDALSFSSMPTEILGELRITVQTIIKQSNNGSINKKLESVIKYIDNAFCSGS